MAQQGLDVLLVQLHPPFRQQHALPLHQRQDRQQQRVGRQLAHAGVALQRKEHLRLLFGGFQLRERRFTLGRLLDRLRPLAEKQHNVVVVEIDQRAFLQPLRSDSARRDSRQCGW